MNRHPSKFESWVYGGKSIRNCFEGKQLPAFPASDDCIQESKDEIDIVFVPRKLNAIFEGAFVATDTLRRFGAGDDNFEMACKYQQGSHKTAVEISGISDCCLRKLVKLKPLRYILAPHDAERITNLAKRYIILHTFNKQRHQIFGSCRRSLQLPQ